jgi:DNA-binding NarL/FixJ family response regulator
MERLSASRLRRVVTAIGVTVELDALPAFADGALAAVRDLVPYDMASYNEIEPGSSRGTSVTDPATGAPRDIDAMLARFAHQHPMIVQHAGGDGQPRRFSDSITRHQLHRLDLYDLLYRPFGIEHQIAFGLHGSPGWVIGFGLSRRQRDFSDDERLMLDLLRPHLRAAHARLVQRDLLTRTVAALDGTDQQSTRAAILLDDQGTIISATATAERLLDARTGEAAPEVLRTWIADSREDRPCGAPTLLLVELQSHRLYARLHPHAPGEPYAITLTVLPEPPSCASLEAIGLSHRHAQIVQALTRDASNAQIAHELGLSIRTVEKHLEHIYAQLAVTNRTHAIRRAVTLTQTSLSE